MKRTRFVRHWTFKTGSDHDTLFVHVQVRGRKRGSDWVDLLLVSTNLGGRYQREDLRDTLAVVKRLGIPAVLAFQEGGDQQWIGDFLRERGYAFFTGDKVGQPSTPMATSPGIKVRGSLWELLLGRVNIGPGAGPAMNKPKWWTRTRLSVDGVRFGASSWHVVPSQQKRKRFLAALKQVAPVVAALAVIRRPFFVIGDTNSDNDQPLSKHLVKRGLVSNHDVLGEIATHGNRSIDAVHTQKRMVLAV